VKETTKDAAAAAAAAAVQKKVQQEQALATPEFWDAKMQPGEAWNATITTKYYKQYQAGLIVYVDCSIPQFPNDLQFNSCTGPSLNQKTLTE